MTTKYNGIWKILIFYDIEYKNSFQIFLPSNYTNLSFP